VSSSTRIDFGASGSDQVGIEYKIVPSRSMAAAGPFATCLPVLRMSVHRGRPEVAVVRSDRANDPGPTHPRQHAPGHAGEDKAADAWMAVDAMLAGSRAFSPASLQLCDSSAGKYVQANRHPIKCASSMNGSRSYGLAPRQSFSASSCCYPQWDIRLPPSPNRVYAPPQCLAQSSLRSSQIHRL
jgi:hypothetical protein